MRQELGVISVNCNNVASYRFHPRQVLVVLRHDSQQIKNSISGTSGSISYSVTKNLRLQGQQRAAHVLSL